MKSVEHKIDKLELIKIDKSYNYDIPTRYHYLIKFNDIDDELIINDLTEPLTSQMIGHSIRFNLNENNQISQFELY